MIRLLSIAAGIVFIVAAMSNAAALEIRITAAARLEVSVTGAGTVAQVAGALRDDLNRGLPQREVLVQIEARQTGQTLIARKVSTDARGRFGVQEELPPGDYEVIVRFDKTDHLDGSADSKSLRLDPAPVDIRAYAPAFVYGRKNPAWLSARANAGQTPYQGWAEVSVAGEPVGRLTLDASGRGTFDVSSHLAVGNNEIRVRTPGSAYRDESIATVTMRFADKVIIEASLDERLERLQRGLAVSGTVRDAAGPLPGVRMAGRIEPLALYDPAARSVGFTASTTTDDKGRFVAFVPATKLDDGMWRGRAEFVPPLGDRVVFDAGSVEIDTRFYRVAVNGFGIMALLLGLALLLARVGRTFVARFMQWRAKREKFARQVAALEEVETIVPVFLSTDAGSSVEISRHDVGGMVWDVWQKTPVAGAAIQMRAAADNSIRSGTSDAAGRFRFADLAPGTWHLEVQRFGFIRGLLEIHLPHDGRMSHFRVDLVAVPLKIRRLYGSVLEHSVGEDLWGQLSPREIETRLDAIWPADGDLDRRQVREAVAARLQGQTTDTVAVLAALTEVVEESYFSGREYGEDAFLFARALALELRARRDAQAQEGP